MTWPLWPSAAGSWKSWRKPRPPSPKNLNQALKDEAREAAQGTDASDWEARNKDANAAQIETEYLEQRNQALELLISWFGQAALIASGAPEVTRFIRRCARWPPRCP